MSITAYKVEAVGHDRTGEDYFDLKKEIFCITHES